MATIRRSLVHYKYIQPLDTLLSQPRPLPNCCAPASALRIDLTNTHSNKFDQVKLLFKLITTTFWKYFLAAMLLNNNTKFIASLLGQKYNLVCRTISLCVAHCTVPIMFRNGRNQNTTSIQNYKEYSKECCEALTKECCEGLNTFIFFFRYNVLKRKMITLLGRDTILYVRFSCRRVNNIPGGS